MIRSPTRLLVCGILRTRAEPDTNSAPGPPAWGRKSCAGSGGNVVPGLLTDLPVSRAKPNQTAAAATGNIWDFEGGPDCLNKLQASAAVKNIRCVVTQRDDAIPPSQTLDATFATELHPRFAYKGKRLIRKGLAPVPSASFPAKGWEPQTKAGTTRRGATLCSVPHPFAFFPAKGWETPKPGVTRSPIPASYFSPSPPAAPPSEPAPAESPPHRRCSTQSRSPRPPAHQ